MTAKAAAPAFYTRYNKPETVPCETGTRYDKTYTMTVDENGHKKLLCTGETDRYAQIQAYKDETLIENILAKATVDPTILNQKAKSYFDATDAPKTLAEAQNKIIAVKQEFEKLPAEVKLKFKNSPEVYVAQYGTKKWGESLGLIKEELEKAEETKEEVKTDAE